MDASRRKEAIDGDDIRRERVGRSVMTEPSTGAEQTRRSLPLFQGLLPIDKAKIPLDLIAGVTLAALAIPEVMGYTTIAGMPVITGMYTILLPMFVFAVLGSSRHLVVGADSATAAVMAAGLAGMAAAGSSQYVALAGLMALIAGAFLIVARLIGLGFLADFLSRTVLIGFLTGVGVQVACGQVDGMLGVPEGDGIDDWGPPLRQHDRQAHLDSAEPRRHQLDHSRRLRGGAGNHPRPQDDHRQDPGTLIAVIGAIFISWNWELASHGVATLGPLPSGLPDIGLPDVSWSDIPKLLGTAVSIFVLILAQSAATSRGTRRSTTITSTRMSIWSASVPRARRRAFRGHSWSTEVRPRRRWLTVQAARVKLAQVTTGVIVAIVLLFLTAPIKYMPVAVLASVVFLIGLELVDIAGMRKVLRLRPDEFVVATLVALTVIVVGVEQGILLAIVASVIDHMRRSYRPVTAVLQPGPNGIWQSVPAAADARSVPGSSSIASPEVCTTRTRTSSSSRTSAFATADNRPSWLCIAAGAIPDIDYSGAETIRQLHGELVEQGVKLVIAEPLPPVRELFDRYGLTELLGADAIYPTVDDVVSAFGSTTPAGPASA